MAIMHSNVAAYWLQTGEFDKAEALALIAAENRRTAASTIARPGR
jgi:hypothetical protein